MSARKSTLQLTSPIVWHDKTITQIVLREPNAGDFFDLGDLGQYVPQGDGYMYIESIATIKAYLLRLVEGEAADLYVGQLCLADAMRLRTLMMDFFLVARQKASPPPATTLS